MCAGQGVTLLGLWSSSSLSGEDQKWVDFLSGHEDSVPGEVLQSRISPSPQKGGRAPLCQAQFCLESQRATWSRRPCAPPAGREVTSTCPAQYGGHCPPVARTQRSEQWDPVTRTCEG